MLHPSLRTLARRALARAGLALALVAPLPLAAQAQEKPEVIRIGSTAPGHLKFVLGREDGWFEKEFAKDGIKVETIAFNNGGSEATTALATGAVEVTYTGNNPALRAAAAGTGIKLVGLSSYVKSTGSVILVKADSPIRTLQDLKGRKVAYLSGTVRHSQFSKALDSVGLKLADVDNLNMAIEASGPALASGDIDALVESDGPAGKLVEKGVARVLYDTSEHPEWNAPFVISVNADFAERYPDIVKRLLKVDLAIAKWADAHPEETIKTFVAATKSSEAAVRKTYPDNRFHQDPAITDEAVAALKSEEKFMADAGLLKGKVDYDKWVDKSFLDAASKEAAAVQ